MASLNPATPATRSFLTWIQIVVYGAVLLYFGRDIFIPLSFALLISFLLFPVCAWLESRGLGRLTAILISLSLLIFLGLLLLGLLVNQFLSFLSEWPDLRLKVTQLLNDLSQLLVDVLGVSKARQDQIISNFSDNSGSSLILMIRQAISASAISTVLFILIPVYSVLILYNRRYWMNILTKFFPAEKKESLREMLLLTIKTYYSFIKGMALVYLLVGFLNSIGLWLLGIPHAFLFGYIVSVLTFIPYVGILVGSLLPLTMAWITYDSLWYPAGVVAIFTFVQYLEANLIFPLAVSHRLNVNTLVMLVAIFTGGILWGMAGMILFVPFTGILKLIADHNPKWEAFAMLLGTEKGKKNPVRKTELEVPYTKERFETFS